MQTVYTKKALENFVKGLVDQVHFLLEMLVGQLRQLVGSAFPRQGEQVRIAKAIDV